MFLLSTEGAIEPLRIEPTTSPVVPDRVTLARRNAPVHHDADDAG